MSGVIRMIRFECEGDGGRCPRRLGPFDATFQVLAEIKRRGWQLTRGGHIFCPLHRRADVEEAGSE